MELVVRNCNWRKSGRNFSTEETPVNMTCLITGYIRNIKLNYLFQNCQHGLTMVARRTKPTVPTVIYSFTRWRFITILSVAVTTSSCYATLTTATKHRRNRTSDIARTRRWTLLRIKNLGSVSNKSTLFWTSMAGRSVGQRTASRVHKVLIIAVSALTK